MKTTQKEATAMEKEITLEQALAWSDKHRQLTSDGARLVHIKQLLQLHSASQLSQIKEEMMRYACDFNWDFEKNKAKHKSYIALEDVVKLLDSHMEEKGQEEKDE